jgi:hypothetical protein
MMEHGDIPTRLPTSNLGPWPLLPRLCWIIPVHDGALPIHSQNNPVTSGTVRLSMGSVGSDLSTFDHCEAGRVCLAAGAIRTIQKQL